MSARSQCIQQTIQNMIFSSTFLLVFLQLTCKRNAKNSIIYSLNFLQSCHCLWISGTDIWYSAHFKESNNSKKKPLRGKEQQESLSTTFFFFLARRHAFCRCMHKHITAETVAEGKSLQNHSVGDGNWGCSNRRNLKKKFCVCCILTLVD